MSKIATSELAKLKILLVDIASTNVERVRLALSQSEEMSFEVCWAGDLNEALTYLRLEACFDVVLLNRTFPECRGLGWLQLLLPQCRTIPVVVLTAVPDDRTTLGTIVIDAEDFLVTGMVSARALIRSIRFAIQRQQYMAAATRYLSELETIDELAPACEQVGDGRETLTLSGASSEHSDHELNPLINVALRDEKAQLQVVVDAFLLLDLLWRNRLAAEGIHICGTSRIAPSDGMHDQRPAVPNSMRQDEPSAEIDRCLKNAAMFSCGSLS